MSDYIRDLPFLWVKVDDEPGPDSDRAYLEQNVIALLSNHQCTPIDEREQWLGQYSRSEKIRDSGLWNVNHVDEGYNPEFLSVLQEQIEQTSPP
ncbi:hypothetical protein [Haloarcula salinisoli]|uniref:hypothetical protein n=1 Tax=Haloarcula salinisoli TaxID=2487746 RepID=UPI001F235247|nr:hypothetical protein [Halomicroarcula salinisoli]